MTDQNSLNSRRARLIASIRRRPWTWVVIILFSLVLLIIMITSAISFAHRHATDNQPVVTAVPTPDMLP